MGDRANIGFRSGEHTGQCVWLYTHWAGHVLPDVVIPAVKYAEPRWGDHSYATRMALTSVIGGVERDTGWGVSTAPGENEYNALVIDWDQRIVSILPASVADDWHTFTDDEMVEALDSATSVAFDVLDVKPTILEDLWRKA